jgi:type IX secretion system PorP/SprF family membrane protein
MSVIAQTDIQMSQHMFNRTTYNPAATGASQFINIYGHWRNQWQGWTGAPQTMYVTAHNYFPSLKSGLGIVALNDKLGFEKNMMFKLSYAYHLHLTPSSYISLGLSAGVLNRNIDFTKAIPETDVPTIYEKVENKWTADFDFGVEYNLEKLTAGLSLTHLNHTADEATELNMGHHFYAYVKYKFSLGVDFDLTPALFAQNSKKSTHIETNLILFYRNKMWIGGSYRVDERMDSESIVGIAGMEIMDFLKIGYSFDYNIGRIGKYASNTHEIMLSIKLTKNSNIYARTPRFFE